MNNGMIQNSMTREFRTALDNLKSAGSDTGHRVSYRGRRSFNTYSAPTGKNAAMDRMSQVRSASAEYSSHVSNGVEDGDRVLVVKPMSHRVSNGRRAMTGTATDYVLVEGTVHNSRPSPTGSSITCDLVFDEPIEGCTGSLFFANREALAWKKAKKE